MDPTQSILNIAFLFFLITNPIGNSPAILALVKDFPFKRQRQIIFREVMLALAVALFFQFSGDAFLKTLNIQIYAVTMAGGVLLFTVSLSMIFSLSSSQEVKSLKDEPFLVPIATPILSGPGLLATIMYQSSISASNLTITFAILIAWVGVLGILMVAPYLQKLLGKNGLIALEQLMGMMLAMMSMGMIVKGTHEFINLLTA